MIPNRAVVSCRTVKVSMIVGTLEKGGQMVLPVKTEKVLPVSKGMTKGPSSSLRDVREV